MTDQPATLYTRLGGYEGIVVLTVHELFPRLRSSRRLARFWANRSADSLRREEQLLVDFLCSRMGGPRTYAGRDMATAHIGLGVTARDWNVFIYYLEKSLNKFFPARERGEVLSFIESLKADIVEA